jgi:osmotically-inducible protein OsmY
LSPNPQNQETIMTHDDQLQKAVLAELNWEPSITAAHIGVMAENGTVTYKAMVRSMLPKWRLVASRA